jgi:predicted negative regulator of RcsB-dependent stress response
MESVPLGVLSHFLEDHVVMVIALVVLAHVAILGWVVSSLYSQTPKQRRMTRRSDDKDD